MQPRRPRRIVPADLRRPGRAQHNAAPAHGQAEPGLQRVSKRMAALGLCSRREADEWIAKGWVRVDGARVTELGTRVGPEARITIDRAAAAEQRDRVTVLLHKPIGVVSGQAEEGYKPAVALIAERTHWKDDPSPIAFRPAHLRGLAPAGRLDIDSTGLLVLTQDGRIARQLIGADSRMEKEYLVRVAGTLAASDLARLRHGLTLDGVPLRPAQVAWINADQLRFVLTEGRKRQIRRMCEAVGLEVQALKRVRIGRVALGRLPPGEWRYLGPDEAFV
jgi:23S rRNA pseudouridine2604 synthase